VGPQCGTVCAVTDSGKDIASWATAAGPSATGHDGSKPSTTVPHDAKICCLYKAEIQPKMSYNSKKERGGGRGEGSEEEVVKVRSSAGCSSR
jgi:hypothetical protein